MNTKQTEHNDICRKPDVGRILVDTGSASADWVRWCSRERRSPLAALDVGGRPEMAFVPDEVLVDDADPDLVRHLIDQFGAEILAPAEIPLPPNGLGPACDVNADLMPIPTRLRFRVPPPASTLAAELLRDTYGDSVSVTSEMAAGVLGLVAQLVSEGREIGINVVGTALELPLLAAKEADPGSYEGPDPFLWSAYTGRTHVTAAWQLIEAYRKLASTKPLVTVAVLDGGFWLNGRVPAFPGGQLGSDFGSFVFQLNLQDESLGAGGVNPNKCTGGYSCPWHGNGVASVAVAPVGNRLGSAGVGGTVARPVFFKSDFSLIQMLRCLQVCLAWGVDVLNMSFGIPTTELFFGTSSWNRTFQFAADNGLIMVASAGNEGQRLPEDSNRRPATRTPGTITVGWLDEKNEAHELSNFGSSVDIWAPGTNLWVMPDEINPKGYPFSGTSAAAPFISGVVAMMRAVNSSLNTFEAKQLLMSSGWRGTGKVTVGVDAFAAVLAAMGGKLPTDLAERNDTRETAAPLYPFGTNGALIPLGNLGEAAALSERTDIDWYRFRVNEFSEFTLQLRSYPLL